MKQRRRGASVSVYLDFELIEHINRFADSEDVNFNDACREILYIAAEAMTDKRKRA